MNMHAAFSPFAWTFLFVASCASSNARVDLRVQLRTDFRSGTEFFAVATELVATGERQLTPALLTSGDVSVRTVAEFPNVSTARGRRVRMTLLGIDETALATRTVSFDQDQTATIQVVITRSCEDVSCPSATGDLQASECLAGECVDPSCVTGTESTCRRTRGCSELSDCPTPSAECARAACIDSVCYSEGSDTTCPERTYCDALRGCRAIPVAADAGPDSSVNDASVQDSENAGACVTLESREIANGAGLTFGVAPSDSGYALVTRDGTGSVQVVYLSRTGDVEASHSLNLEADSIRPPAVSMDTLTLAAVSGDELVIASYSRESGELISDPVVSSEFRNVSLDGLLSAPGGFMTIAETLEGRPVSLRLDSQGRELGRDALFPSDATWYRISSEPSGFIASFRRNPDCYARHIGPDGVALGGGPELINVGECLNQDLARGPSSYAAVWHRRASGSVREVYFRPFDTNLTPTAPAQRLSGAGANRSDPVVAWDGSAFQVAWSNNSSSPNALETSRVGSTGEVLGTEQRTLAVAGSVEQVQIARSGEDTAIFWVEAGATNRVLMSTRCPE